MEREGRYVERFFLKRAEILHDRRFWWKGREKNVSLFTSTGKKGKKKAAVARQVPGKRERRGDHAFISGDGKNTA